MLQVYTSNQLEVLVENLARVLREPLPTPFHPEIIIVQSKGMERWVSLELARRNQICANSVFPFPNAFLHECFKKLIPEMPDISVFDPGIMTFRLMKVLPKCIKRPEFKGLRNYLREDPGEIKRFQLAEKIADIFDQYLVFRPKMIFSWESGREDHWQAYLWRLLTAGKEKQHRARLRKMLLEALANQTIDISDLPARLSIFGISSLPPFHIQVFLELSRLIPVYLYLMNPCREYWADIVSDREIKKIRKGYPPGADLESNLHLERGNRLLAATGTLGRDFFTQINEIECDLVEQFEDPGRHDLLSCVQSDILNLVDRNQTLPGPDFQKQADPSIQINSCHSPMREVEILHDHLLAMFEADPELLPKDIIVMTPDIEAYAPYIQAVFNVTTDPGMRIPFSIADRCVQKESRLIDGFLAILDLKDSRMGAAQIMNLLETKDVSEKFDLSSADIGMVEQWVRETNIRWGIDSSSREKSGTPPLKDNTWQAGLERLLLGYAMPEKREELFSEILPYDHIEGKDGLVLGRFLNFMDQIIDFIDQVETDRDLDQWNGFLNKFLDDFFLPHETSEAELLTLRRFIAELPLKKEIAGFNEAIGIDVIRTYLGHYLDGEVFGYGFISGGVTFCAMLPMRSIPFKVVCLIGMNTDAFPRQDRPVGFDLIHKHPQRGDRSRRNDDKYLFLEALISARNRFYISYVGQSIQDNSTRPPSVLVSELIDYLERGFGMKGDRLVTRHRLQAFSPAYFQGEKELFSYSEENLRACAGLLESQRQPKLPAPFISTDLHMTPEEAQDRKHLDISALATFYSNPARYLLQKRLGVYLAEDLPQVEDRENFELSPLEKYAIGQDLVNRQISGVAPDSLQGVLKARGLLPHGTVGDVCYNRLSADAETFLRKTAKYADGHCLDPLSVEQNLAEIHLVGKLGNIYKEKMIQRIYAKFKPKYLLNTWIYHTLLNVINKQDYPLKTLLICRDGVWEFSPISQSRKIITGLLEFYQAGLIQPASFFPDSSYAYARELLGKNQSEKRALSVAESRWNGSDFVRGERQDPYFERCFGWMEPQILFGPTFKKTALDIFGPLMTHSRKLAL